MEQTSVDQVIAALSKIEKSAEGIKSETEQKKSRYAEEIEDKIKIFDQELAQKHKENMERLKETLEAEKNESMQKLRLDMEAEVGKLDEIYEKRHQELAKDIFEQMLAD